MQGAPEGCEGGGEAEWEVAAVDPEQGGERGSRGGAGRLKGVGVVAGGEPGGKEAGEGEMLVHVGGQDLVDNIPSEYGLELWLSEMAHVNQSMSSRGSQQHNISFYSNRQPVSPPVLLVHMTGNVNSWGCIRLLNDAPAPTSTPTLPPAHMTAALRQEVVILIAEQQEGGGHVMVLLRGKWGGTCHCQRLMLVTLSGHISPPTCGLMSLYISASGSAVRMRKRCSHRSGQSRGQWPRGRK